MQALDSWDWADIHHLALGEARRILGRGHDADDAAQEATIRAWRRRDSCRDTPYAWIRTIARREALRVAGRQRDDQPLDQTLTQADDATYDPSLADVHTAVAALEPDDRLLVLLRYWGDLSQPQVAAAASMPEGTVKVRLHRARQRLRVALSAPHAGRSHPRRAHSRRGGSRPRHAGARLATQ
jgi:RNA polymerase sigma-70 factor, ECF subfamily